MPDENRFAGLGDQLDPADAPESTPAEDESSAATVVDEGDEGPDFDVDEGDESDSGPAFEFDDTQAKSLYVRPETIQLLEDAEFEVEAILRRDHGIRDLTGREFHDALVRAVAANPEVVADLVVDSREE